MKAMVASSSPRGQSMISKKPQIMTPMMPLVQEMKQGTMAKIQQLVEESKAALLTPPIRKPLRSVLPRRSYPAGFLASSARMSQRGSTLARPPTSRFKAAEPTWDRRTPAHAGRRRA